MNPIKTENVPASGGGYVPYFYQAGLFEIYATPADRRRSQPDAGRSTADRFPPDQSLAHRLDRTQTVEQVIAHGYFAVPQGDPITAIISDKQQTSWPGLDDLISQVRRRYEIYGFEPSFEDASGTDLAAVARSRVSVTAIHFDLTDRSGLDRLRGWDLDSMLAAGRVAAGG